MTGLFYSSYQFCFSFPFEYFRKQFREDKATEDNTWCFIVITSTWTILPSKLLKEPTCRFSYFIIMHGSTNESSFYLLNLLLSSQI